MDMTYSLETEIEKVAAARRMCKDFGLSFTEAAQAAAADLRRRACFSKPQSKKDFWNGLANLWMAA